MRKFYNLKSCVKIRSIIATLLLILCTTFYNTGYSQSLISVNLKNVTLEQALTKILRNTEYGISFASTDIQKIKNISVEATNKQPLDILRDCLSKHGLGYKLNGKTVVVFDLPKGQPKADRMIYGNVVGIDKKPVVGATIILKTSPSVGAISNNEGSFAFKVPANDESQIIVVSCVGKKTKEIKLGEETRYVVDLEEDNYKIEDVYVTGYETIANNKAVGSYDKIDAKDLKIDPSMSIEQIIQGKLAGVQVTNNSGMVGARQKTRVRGTTTLFGNQEPVWVVDGVIQYDPLPFSASELDILPSGDMVKDFIGNAISWLNPNDIQDITVLKDASATALYGVKAANGVIVIATKRGEKGRPISVSYTGSMGISSKVTYDKMSLMNSKERMAVSYEIYDRGIKSTAATPAIGFNEALAKYESREYTVDQFNARLRYLETLNTDWFDLLFTNPISHNHNIGISGGSETTTYRSSFGYSETKGTAKGNDRNSFTGSAALTYSPIKKLTFGVSLNISRSNTFAYYNGVDPFSYASKTSRVIPAYDENGEYYRYLVGSNKFNYLYELEHTGSKNTANTYNASVNVNYDILRGLKFTSSYSVSSTSVNGESYMDERSHKMSAKRGYDYGEAQTGDGSNRVESSKYPVGGQFLFDNVTSYNYSWNSQLQYSKTIGLHSFNAMVGYQVSSTKSGGYSDELWGYMPDKGRKFTILPDYTTASDGVVIYIPREAPKTKILDRVTNSVGIYGSLGYSYESRYVLSASVRSDASNKFGQDTRNRFNPIWAAGGRWNVAEEKWMRNQNIISNLSIRFSYGYQGNIADNIGPNLLAKYAPGVYDKVTGNNLLELVSLPYADLDWEKTQSINLGADFGLFNKHVMFSVNFYYKNTQDLIISKTLPHEYGIATMPMNGGSLENKGIDFSFNLMPIRTENILWSVTFNFARNFNKLKETTVKNQTWEMAANGSVNREGYPISGFWAFDYIGLNPNDGYPNFNLDYPAGEDPIATPSVYMKYMGEMEPTINSGFNTSFRYKRVTINAGFTLMLGGYKFLAPAYSDVSGAPSEYTNLPKELVDRWTPDNKDAVIPGIPMGKINGGSDLGIVLPGQTVGTNRYHMYNNSQVRVANASMFKCNNLSISYTLPEKLVNSIHVKNISLNASVSNPFRIKSKDFKGVDPEVATGLQPITRAYNFGINITF